MLGLASGLPAALRTRGAAVDATVLLCALAALVPNAKASVMPGAMRAMPGVLDRGVKMAERERSTDDVLVV